MPIGGKPLLEYWLQYVKNTISEKTLINTHYLNTDVELFLSRNCFNNLFEFVYEKKLLGTAGTLIHNSAFFKDSKVLLVHADNWTNVDLNCFINFHNSRINGCVISMMVFNTNDPKNCGVVDINNEGIVTGFYEKVDNPPTNLANAAVYLLEPEVLEWLIARPWITDFSTEVIPHFINKIQAWENKKDFKDIGSPKMLKLAQFDNKPKLDWDNYDDWSLKFKKNNIHNLIDNIEITI